ncbi:MAG: DUF3570 domain-containing protein [Steroidobacteraceae bacterium]
MLRDWRIPSLAAALLVAAAAHAGVLPEERADVMYHSYSGGGITVEGPSVLVRKNFGDSVSATANYYVDAITSASIDVVVSGASQYTERREQKSLSLDYLHGKSTWSLSYVNSTENDYKAGTFSLGVSQDMFGDLTTVTLGFSQGLDKVGSSLDPTFAQEIERRNYRLGVTQVLTRNMLLALNFEAVTEQGYLQNPYRFMRYENPLGGYIRAPEVFPHTRTGTAASTRLKYYLPWRATVEGQYRYYTDTWGINAHTTGIEYTQPLGRWVLSGSYRFYRQNAANFFSDLFPFANSQNFMARDKETSGLSSDTLGIRASYQFPVSWASWLKKGTANLHFTHMMVDYAQFRDLRNFPPGSPNPGTEPLYSLEANIIQFFVSFWF